MSVIRLRFVTEDDLVSALIREKTFSPYSHVEFLLDDGTTLGARHEDGVQIRPFNYAHFSRTEILSAAVTDDEKRAILAFAHAQVGKPYDTGAILGLCADRDWRDPTKWFCSELCTAAFQQAHPVLRIADNIDRITPRDLLLSPELS